MPKLIALKEIVDKDKNGGKVIVASPGKEFEVAANVAKKLVEKGAAENIVIEQKESN
jgi:hypothetical protein